MKLQIAFVLTQVALILCSDVIIQTEYGKIRGETKTLLDKQYTNFLGVPFAAAPLGKLRFKPLQRHAGWGEDTLDALEYGPVCPQMPGINFSEPYFPERVFKGMEDEDCMFLNIYVPGDMSEHRSSPLPVLVIIHGGGFVIGNAKAFTGDALTTFAEPIILVGINYRLGSLGFLTTGDDVLPGNEGLKDQVFALKWVQENIAAFGGDPDQVTICGESAGGESILAHMVSPMSAGLFHKASAQSAPPLWGYPPKELVGGYFKTLAKALDCEGDSSTAEVECLQTKTWQEIYAVKEIPMFTLVQRVIDGEFITENPLECWSEGKYNDADLMIGFTSDDGAGLLEFFAASDFYTNRSNDMQALEIAVRFGLVLQLSDDKADWQLIKRDGQALANYADLRTVIKARYYDPGQTEAEKARGILDAARDTIFVVFSLFAANEMAKREDDVYFYIFDHISEPYPEYELKTGARHASELPYQFGYGFIDAPEVSMTANEIILSRSLIQAWTSFTAGYVFDWLKSSV